MSPGNDAQIFRNTSFVGFEGLGSAVLVPCSSADAPCFASAATSALTLSDVQQPVDWRYGPGILVDADGTLTGMEAGESARNP